MNPSVVCAAVWSPSKMKTPSDPQTYRWGQGVWRFILHRGQARLWWFRQTVAVTTCRERQRRRELGEGRGGEGGIWGGENSSLPLCLSTDDPCRLGVANRYIKAVKRPLRHDDGILQEQPALWCWHVKTRTRSPRRILCNKCALSAFYWLFDIQ